MKELNFYIEQINELNSIFDAKFCTGAKPLSLNSARDRKTIAEYISCDLSPENLSCDGYLADNKIRSRYTFLSKAAAQLKKLDPSVTIYS